MNRPFLRQYTTVNILIILVSELNGDRLSGPSYRYLLLGSLSNDNGDGNENSKKAIGLISKNNNFARASRFYVHFSAVIARLQRESAKFHVLSRTGTQENNFLFLLLNFDTVL